MQTIVMQSKFEFLFQKKPAPTELQLFFHAIKHSLAASNFTEMLGITLNIKPHFKTVTASPYITPPPLQQIGGNDAVAEEGRKPKRMKSGVSIAQVKIFPPDLLFSVAMESNSSTSAEQL